MVDAVELASSGARLIENDEETFSEIDDRLGRLRRIHSTPTHDCAAIMATLEAKQQAREERRKKWWGRIFG